MATLKLKPSKQASAILRHLSQFGIYGQTPEEVACRFLDEKLIEVLTNHAELHQLRLSDFKQRKRKK